MHDPWPNMAKGSPWVVPMYAIGIKPLIDHLKHVPSVKQEWYANDVSATGTIFGLSEWWNTLAKIGPIFGYHPKTIKAVLLVEDQYLNQANCLFDDTGISITTHGHCALGSPTGSTAYIEPWYGNKVNFWSSPSSRLLVRILRVHTPALPMV